MDQSQFSSEKDYQRHLEARWIDDVEDLMTENGQGYFELLVESLWRLFGAERVVISSFDLEYQYCSTVADCHQGELVDSYDFFVPNTLYETLSRQQTVIKGERASEQFTELADTEAVIGRPLLDENGSVIGAIVVYCRQPVPFVEAANGILDFCLGRIESELVPVYKSRQLNELNHQLLRELALSNQLREDMTRLSFVDTVTHLPNREAFFSEAELIGNHSKQWLGVVGIDCFRSLNDALGMEFGDKILRAVGQRLSELNLPKLRVYKWTGDEFILIGLGATEKDVHRQLDVCHRVFDLPFDIEGTQVKMTGSCGATHLSKHERIADAIRGATSALQLAKTRGGNRHEMYHDSMSDSDNKFFRVHSLMQEGIQRQQFTAYYQPIFDPRSEHFVGYEALMRWIGQDGQSVYMPEQFIPIAERSGLIVDMGKEMIGAAVGNLQEWNELHNDGRALSINLSPLQFHDEQLVKDIESIVNLYGVDPGLLKFEITESLFVHDGDYVLGKLQDLKSLGCRLSLDDFGTGYSSLAYLQKYPFDQIKIDKCFIDDVLESKKSRALIKAVRSLATDLDMQVVAEGVESEQQADCLTQIGVDYLQGFYFSEPIPTDQVDRTFRDDWRSLHTEARLRTSAH